MEPDGVGVGEWERQAKVEVTQVDRCVCKAQMEPSVGGELLQVMEVVEKVTKG